jgi:hypothetical protein
MWEEEDAESESWEEEETAAIGRRQTADGTADGRRQTGYGTAGTSGSVRPDSRLPTAVPTADSRLPTAGAKGITPLDQMLFMPNLKVTRTPEERVMKGPPPGWTHPRPAELVQPAPPPPRPSRPSSKDEVVPTEAAVKTVPPSAQKMNKKDREKMGAMLDDLLSKSKKR